ncbi:DUF6541 family protein [Olsenella massiliensis]|uniref:DUF6541 family protein n=1 Tax=Olsenella massiliensis TaxID=1622075 RepID=UPI002E2697FB
MEVVRMWSSFVVASLALCAFLLLPGYLVLRGLGATRSWSVCLSPLVSLSLLALVGQALALAGVTAPAGLVLGGSTLIGLLTLACLHERGPALCLPALATTLPPLYALAGGLLGWNLLILRLGSPDVVFQAYDVTWHLDLIQAMADSGHLSSLGASPYLSAADAAIAPISTSGFYPAAWHVLCALVCQATGVATPVVINASMFVIACLGFPLSALALISTIFPDDASAPRAGLLCCLAFVSFPWNMLTFGPLYANVAGFALMPSAMALFVHLVSKGPGAGERLRAAALLTLCVAGLALCHPNTLFSCAVLLAPHCVSRIWDVCEDAGLPRPQRLLCCAAFAGVFAGVWLVCYHLPAFQATVSHRWPPFSWTFQELVNILVLSYNFGFDSEVACQPLLAALVVAGFVRCLHRRPYRWLCASYAAACLIMFVSATRSGPIKQLLAGFWYTDPMRLAALCAIAAIPLATQGLVWVREVALRAADAYGRVVGRPAHPRRVVAVLAAGFAIITFMPSFNLAGLRLQLSPEEVQRHKDDERKDWPKSVRTTFGDYRSNAVATYAFDTPLDKQEQELLAAVAERVPTGSLVINDPMDGSFLAYGAHGIRVLYRTFTGFGSSAESPESEVIRTRLAAYATDQDVQEAVRRLDARYVLVLRGTEETSGFVDLRDDYDESLFLGIRSIGPQTPGFARVVSSEAGALYEIVR